MKCIQLCLKRHPTTSVIFQYFEKNKYNESFTEDINQISRQLCIQNELSQELLDKAPQMSRLIKEIPRDNQPHNEHEKEILDTLKLYTAGK